jgi:hypothetical protein
MAVLPPVGIARCRHRAGASVRLRPLSVPDGREIDRLLAEPCKRVRDQHGHVPKRLVADDLDLHRQPDNAVARLGADPGHVGAPPARLRAMQDIVTHHDASAERVAPASLLALSPNLIPSPGASRAGSITDSARSDRTHARPRGHRRDLPRRHNRVDSRSPTDT